jgi:glycine cleavage system aminomethyltransferase T
MHRRAGAVFTDCQGWEMPARFTTSETEATRACAAAGLADISYKSKFDSRTRISPCSWKLSTRRYLTIGEPSLGALKAAIDVTAAFTNLLLVGPNSRKVLGMLTSLDVGNTALPDRTCAQTRIAHVHAAILREDIKHVLAFHVLIPREYSESAWTSILHAGIEFGICPVGLEALELLRD